MADEIHTSSVHKAAEKAHHAVDSTEEIAELVERRIREVADEIREQARRSVDETQHKSQEITGAASQYMREHPYASLGIAFVAGVVVSSLLRRK